MQQISKPLDGGIKITPQEQLLHGINSNVRVTVLIGSHYCRH